MLDQEIVGTGLLCQKLLRDGLLGDGLLGDGLLRDGLLRDGLLRHGLLRHGLLRDGLLRHGPLQEKLLNLCKGKCSLRLHSRCHQSWILDSFRYGRLLVSLCCNCRKFNRLLTPLLCHPSPKRGNLLLLQQKSQK